MTNIFHQFNCFALLSNCQTKNGSKVPDLYVWYKMTGIEEILNQYKLEKQNYKKYLSDYRKSIHNESNHHNESKIVTSNKISRKYFLILSQITKKETEK